MAEGQIKTQPLEWESQYLKLLSSMDSYIYREQKTERKEKWLRYQVLIIAGGHFGLRAKEFLHMSWSQLVGKTETDIFQFKTRRKRKIYLNDKVTYMINENYKRVSPVNINHLVLHKKGSPMAPVSTRQFNESFAEILKECGIAAINPSSHTLRKTFAHHIWSDIYDKTEEGVMVASEMLDHQDTKETKAYLGISEKKIKETYMRL